MRRKQSGAQHKQTKEIIVDFRRKKSPLSPLLIDGKTVEIVHHVKFLGSMISSDLKWELNIDTIAKKAQQRLYFLRRLRSFDHAKLLQSVVLSRSRKSSG